MKKQRGDTPGMNPVIWGALTILTVFLILGGCNRVTEQEAHQRELVAAGHASYRAYCAGCHGLTARGGGPAAEWMTVKPADLTGISRRYGTFPTQTIYQRIEGATKPSNNESIQMPHFGEIWRGMNKDWETQEEVRLRIEELVAYLQSIQA